MACRPVLQSGLWEASVEDESVASVELTLSFSDERIPRLVVPLAWVGENRFQALFHVSAAVERVRVDIAPRRPDADPPEASFRKVGKSRLVGEAWRRLSANIAQPRLLLRKLRYYFSGTANTGLSLAGEHKSDDAAYRRWASVYDGCIEALAPRQRGKTLAVYLSVVDNETALADFLDQDFTLVALLVVEFDDAPLTPALRRRVDQGDALRISASPERFSLAEVFTAAVGLGCSALIFLERSGLHHRRVFDLGLAHFDAHPDCLAVYADSDFVDNAGERRDPVFKPEWSPEYLLAWNYVRAPCLFRVDRATADVAADIRCVGAPALALLLAIDREGRAGRIQRIPLALFHEREEDSTRERRTEREQRAVEAWSRQQEDAPEIGSGEGGTRVIRHARKSSPLVSVVIPSRDNPAMLEKAVQSVLEADYPRTELILVDNGSRDARQRALLADYSGRANLRVIEEDAAFNFSALINRGRRVASGEMLLMLNDDVEALDTQWLDELVALALRPRVGCVGALLLYPDHSVQHAGVVLGVRGMVEHALLGAPVDDRADRRLLARHEVSAVTAACLAVRTAIFDRVGGLDESLAVTFNDIDFCLKVRDLGLNNLLTPQARLLHHESASRGLDIDPEKQRRARRELRRFLSRWEKALADDPFYSPNMNRRQADFRLRSSG